MIYYISFSIIVSINFVRSHIEFFHGNPAFIGKKYFFVKFGALVRTQIICQIHLFQSLWKSFSREIKFR